MTPAMRMSTTEQNDTDSFVASDQRDTANSPELLPAPIMRPQTGRASSAAIFSSSRVISTGLVS